MYRAFHYPPGRERLHAIGALDLALWDLKAKALNVPVKYSELPGIGHNSWDTAYRDPEVATWLFAQKKN